MQKGQILAEHMFVLSSNSRLNFCTVLVFFCGLMSSSNAFMEILKPDVERSEFENLSAFIEMSKPDVEKSEFENLRMFVLSGLEDRINGLGVPIALQTLKTDDAHKHEHHQSVIGHPTHGFLKNMPLHALFSDNNSSQIGDLYSRFLIT